MMDMAADDSVALPETGELGQIGFEARNQVHRPFDTMLYGLGE